MPINDPGTLARELMARLRGVPDASQPSFRYAEGRQSRSPIVFRPDVDPLGQILNSQTFNQRPDPGRDAMMAERGGLPMGSDEAASLNVDPTKLNDPNWKARLRVGGFANPQMNPLEALRIARGEAPEGQGPGTIDAYDQLERLLMNRGASGGIQIAAPTAETADPNRVRHEEGHMLSYPFLGEFQKMMGSRFGVGPSAASEALAYRYQGNEDPTSLAPLVDRLLPSMGGPRVQRFQRGLKPPLP